MRLLVPFLINPARRTCPLVRRMAESTDGVHTAVEVTIPLPGGGHIAGKAWGNPIGQPVLATHGWLNNAATFDKLAPLLGKDLYVVSIDLPGHGLSSHTPPGARHHFTDYVIAVKAVVNSLGWEKFSFLCHSMGASVATMFAAAQPSLVKNMVLIENIGLFSRRKEDIPKLMGKALDAPLPPKESKVYKTKDDIVTKLLEGNGTLDKRLPREGAELLAARGVKSVGGGEEGGYQFTHDARLKMPSVLYVSHEVNFEFIKAISCPTLVILGEDTVFKDDFNKRLDSTPRDKSISLRSKIVYTKLSSYNKIKVVKLDGGHFLHLYNHEILAPLVSHFLLTSSLLPPHQEISRL